MATINLPASLEVATLAKALRILAQAAHEINCSLTDAATDLELLAPDDEAGVVVSQPSTVAGGASATWLAD